MEKHVLIVKNHFKNSRLPTQMQWKVKWLEFSKKYGFNCENCVDRGVD